MNRNQKIILNWWESLDTFPISSVYLTEAGRNVPVEVRVAYDGLSEKEEAELLKVYADSYLKDLEDGAE